MPIKPNITTKSDYAARPSIAANQKESAAEFNLLVNAIRANYDRLLLDWLTDIPANTTLLVGQYVLFSGLQYKIITSYNVGNPITWESANAEQIGGGSIAVAQGLVDDSGVIKFGGNISEVREIDLSGTGSLKIKSEGANTQAEVYIVRSANDGRIIFTATNAAGFVALEIDPGAVSSAPGGIKIYEGRAPGSRYGLTYYGFGGDYSDLTPESLVPKELVEQMITAIIGAVNGTYTDIAALLADQSNQLIGAWYMVQDASADPTVDADWAIYQKLIASTADLSDYFKIAEKESLDIVINNASETAKGISEEATDAETQAGTAVGGTGAKLFVTPTKLATWWTWIKTLAHTLADKITFTTAPRFSSTTASQFLKVDANKDLISVASATQAEAIAGTDDTKPLTSLSLESKRSVKSTSVSNGATGTTNIDCGLKQELKVIFNTTVTGGITITLSNDTNLEVLHLIIPITGSNIGINMPTPTRMGRYFEVSSGDGWYQGTKVLQVSSVGTADLHEFSLVRIASTPLYKINYDGPTRA